MTDFDKLFAPGEPDREKLLINGFMEEESGFYRESPLLDFVLRVRVGKSGKVSAEIYDPEADAPYTLHLVEGAGGEFVGKIRTVYERELMNIAETCFNRAMFRSRLAREVIAYVSEKYGENIEYLWEKFPDNGVIRRKDNRKWYAAVLTTNGNKVGVPTDEIVEILDIRASAEVINRVINVRGFAPAWHMNKKSWVTVLLDGSVEFSTIARMVDESRELALKK